MHDFASSQMHEIPEAARQTEKRRLFLPKPSNLPIAGILRLGRGLATVVQVTDISYSVGAGSSSTGRLPQVASLLP